MLPTEMSVERIIVEFQDFAALVDPGIWRRMADQLRAEVRGNGLLAGLHDRQHRLVFALAHLEQEYAEGRHVIPNTPDLYEACTMVAQFLAVVRAHPDSAKGLIGRMRGALKNPADMHAMQFEFQVATHLAKAGMEVVFPELQGGGTFDILATDPRTREELEFECKCLAEDKGQAVTQRVSADLSHRLKPDLDRFGGTHAQAGRLLRIRFDGEAPADQASHKRIREVVDDVLYASSGFFIRSGNVIVSVDHFDVAGSPFLDPAAEPTAAAIREFASSLGVGNAEYLYSVYPTQCAVLVAYESEKRSTLFANMFDTIEKAARNQLTGRRPAAVCVKVSGINGDQLRGLAADEVDAPVHLRLLTGRFFTQTAASRISLLAYFADEAAIEESGAVMTRGGAVYSFRNPNNAFADTQIRTIFSLGARPHP
ncbi:hypothetical protein [Lysobacter sp. HA18]